MTTATAVIGFGSATVACTEEWRPVAEFEGAYEVSSLGRVRSLDRVVTGADGKTQKWVGRVLTPGSSGTRSDYPRANLWRNSVRVQKPVHALVAAAFLGPQPPGTEVRHYDGNPRHNAATNLRYGTRRENQLDSVRHGTHRYYNRRTEQVESSTVTCTCWCSADEVSIPVEWIGEGRTKTCSLPDCYPDCPSRAYDAFELEYPDDNVDELTTREKKRMTTIEYDPAADSSPGTAHLRATYPGLILLAVGGCQCGCNKPKSAKSRFLPGHDAKLKGKLQRALAAETPVQLVGPDGSVMTTTAENVARDYGWLENVTKGADRIIRRSQTPIAAERRVAALVAEREGDPAYSLIFFGRWDETGRALAMFGHDGQIESVYATEEGTVEVVTQDGPLEVTNLSQEAAS